MTFATKSWSDELNMILDLQCWSENAALLIKNGQLHMQYGWLLAVFYFNMLECSTANRVDIDSAAAHSTRNCWLCSTDLISQTLGQSDT